MIDVPLIDTLTGNPTTRGNLYMPGFTPAAPPTVLDPNNNINYFSGAFTVTFQFPPKAGVAINSQTVPSVVARPLSMLYYNNQFTLRPVPDQPYQINFEVYKRPTVLLDSEQVPELEPRLQCGDSKAARTGYYGQRKLRLWDGRRRRERFQPDG